MGSRWRLVSVAVMLAVLGVSHQLRGALAQEPLFQPVCNAAVVLLATDAALTNVRLSKSLNIERFVLPDAVRLPPGQRVVDGKLAADARLEISVDEVTLPANPAIELVGGDNKSYALSAPATLQLDSPAKAQLVLPSGTTATTAEGEAVMAAGGAKGRLSLAKGELGSGTVTVPERTLVHPDNVREITLQLAPSDSGPRLQVTVEAPAVDFDPAKNPLTACLVSDQGTKRSIQVVDVDAYEEPGTARISLAIPQAMSTLSLDRFLTGDTTYEGQAYLVSESAPYVGVGRASIHGIKASILVGIAATVLLLSAIAAMRLFSTGRPAGVGAFFKDVIVGTSGDASLSLFQIALWTLVTFFALVYVWWRTGAPITISTEMLGLLGFAGAGSVAARWIAASRTPGGQQNSGPTSDALNAAVEEARRLRAEADSLAERAEQLTTSENNAKARFEATLPDRTAAEANLRQAEEDLVTAQSKADQARQDLAAKQEIAASADDATKEQAEKDVTDAEARLDAANAAVAEQQGKIDEARAALAPADKARETYQQAVLDAARQIAARDTARRLADEADQRLTNLRSARHNPSLVEMLMSGGRPDLFKVQLFLFTTFTALYVAGRVVMDMAFPPIGEGLLLLMGVSNGGYIGAKLAEPSPLQKAQALQVELDALEKRVTTLTEEQKQLQNELAAIQKSLAAADVTAGAREVFNARLATINARLAAIEKDGKGELPETKAAADAKRKEFQEQLAAATKPS